MKKDQNIPELSRSEFAIMRILWNKAPLSVREVHDMLKVSSNWAYTTTKTMMDRMVKKGLLSRDSFHGLFLYKPMISRPQGFARWIEFFADRVMELDYSSILALFGKSQALSREEIEELTRLLQELKGESE